MDSHSYEKVSGQDDGGDVGRSEGLLDPGSDIPTATATEVCEVVAPASLPEGYEFEADLGRNRTIRVKVPQGGIEEGQAFPVPMPDEVRARTTDEIRIPVGHWRDDLCSCFAYGACHPHCWTSLFPLVAAGQVQSRMRLTWNGENSESSGARYIGAFQSFVTLTVVYYVSKLFLGSLLFLPYWIFFTIVLYKTRVAVRRKYAIPTDLCTSEAEKSATALNGHVEDCLLSCCCHCCVAGQMLRHTTDYETYPSQCCTETGIPPHAPSIV